MQRPAGLPVCEISQTRIFALFSRMFCIIRNGVSCDTKKALHLQFDCKCSALVKEKIIVL